MCNTEVLFTSVLLFVCVVPEPSSLSAVSVITAVIVVIGGVAALLLLLLCYRRSVTEGRSQFNDYRALKFCRWPPSVHRNTPTYTYTRRKMFYRYVKQYKLYIEIWQLNVSFADIFQRKKSWWMLDVAKQKVKSLASLCSNVAVCHMNTIWLSSIYVQPKIVICEISPVFVLFIYDDAISHYGWTNHYYTFIITFMVCRLISYGVLWLNIMLLTSLPH